MNQPFFICHCFLELEAFPSTGWFQKQTLAKVNKVNAYFNPNHNNCMVSLLLISITLLITMDLLNKQKQTNIPVFPMVNGILQINISTFDHEYHHTSSCFTYNSKRHKIQRQTIPFRFTKDLHCSLSIKWKKNLKPV